MRDITHQFYAADIDESKTVSGLSYLVILFFLPLMLRPKSRFGRFHANQSLVILIGAAIGCIGLWLLRLLFGLISYGLLRFFVVISILFYIAIGIYYLSGLLFGLAGRAVHLPFLSRITLINYKE